MLLSHPHLAGLAGQFTPDQVDAACNRVLGFPFPLVTSLSEAGRVVEYLRNA